MSPQRCIKMIGKILIFVTLFVSSCSPQVLPTPEEPVATAVSTQEIGAIDVVAGEEFTYQMEGMPSIHIPSNVVSESGSLNINPIESPSVPSDMLPASPAYEITLLANDVLREPIEIALPIDPSISIGEEGEIYIAYYSEGNGWISLPSWFSDEDNMVHATVNHLSIFRVFYSLFPRRPKIVSLEASPNPYQNVGWPPCFSDPLSIQLVTYDPDDRIEKVEARIRIHNFATGAITDAVRLTTAMYGLGLVMASGGAAALLPAATTILELGAIRDPGIAASGWAEIIETPDQPGNYSASIDLSPISTCGNDSFDADAIVNGVGIEKIVIDVLITDASGKTREDSIAIPVHAYSLPYAELISPGPSESDVQSTLPTFSWTVEQDGETDYAQRLVYAKGDSLWDRWWGTTSVEREWNERDWTPPSALKPGVYVWGVEVSSDGSFRKETITRSTVFRFTVLPIWAELTVDGTIVTRSEVTGISPEALKLAWVASYNGEEVIEHLRKNDMSIDILDYLDQDNPESGEYLVWLDMWDDASNEYITISNPVLVILDVKPTFTLSTNAYCRSGPGLDYGAAIKWPLAGDVLPVKGRLQDNSYFVVEVDSVVCWIKADTGTLKGNPNSLPIVEPPPTPKPVPTAVPTQTPKPYNPYP